LRLFGGEGKGKTLSRALVRGGKPSQSLGSELFVQKPIVKREKK